MSTYSSHKKIEKLIKEGKYNEAYKRCEQHFEKNTKISELEIYAELCYKVGNYQKAQAILQKISTLDKNNIRALFNLGILFQANNQIDEAIKSYQEAINRKPTYIDALNNQGLLFSSLKRFTEAEENFRKILSIQPNSYNATNNLGNILASAGRTLEAEGYYKKCIGLNKERCEPYNNLGALYYERGLYEDAKFEILQAIRLNPQYKDAYNNLGNVFKALGKVDDAIDEYRKSISIDPRYKEAIFNMGVALEKIENYTDAIDCYRNALEIDPSYFDAANNLGNVYKIIGNRQKAKECYLLAIKLKNTFAEAHNNLGLLYTEDGELDKAKFHLERAIDIDPKYYIALNNLGNTLRELGCLTEAEKCYVNATGINPTYAEAFNNLGIVRNDMGKRAAATDAYHAALKLKSDYAEVYNNLGLLQQEKGELENSLSNLLMAHKIYSASPEIHSNIGNVMRELGRLQEAERWCRAALMLDPGKSKSHNNLGNILKEIGAIDKAVESYRNALNIKYDPRHHSNLLFTMCLSENLTDASYIEEAKIFGQRNKRQSNIIKKQRIASYQKIKIGFLSGDMRTHPVGFFIEGLLENIDKNKFEVVGYSTVVELDSYGKKIMEKFDLYRFLYGISDENSAKIIGEDTIDILIDLSGHTANNRLPILTFKPATILVSWLGYFASTGLDEVDYILADNYVVPKDSKELFIEKIYHLPNSYICMKPIEDAPIVMPLPALTNGFITFGCFNNLSKVNDDVINIWVNILDAVPQSKLFLKTKQLNTEESKELIKEKFRYLGVGSERLILEGASPRIELLSKYSKIDISLDPFPFPGGTTTFESLWMGVPVLTLSGKDFLSRVGESIMINAGLSEWVAENKDDYVKKALQFSSKIDDLDRTRSKLREQVKESPLFNAKLFAKNFEDAMFNIYKSNLNVNNNCNNTN
jgi:protein O-GlcNAc transferase